MDLSTLSLAELRRLQSRVAAEIQKRSDVERRTLLKQFRKMAQDKGLSFSELIANDDETAASPPAPKSGRKPGAAKAQKKLPLPPRYFNPENSAQTWSGRGRKPQWLLDWVAQDKPLEELERKT